MMKFCGMNGLSQFHYIEKQTNIFKDFNIPFINKNMAVNLSDVHIQCTWNVIVMAVGNKIIQMGFLSRQPIQTAFIIAEDKIKQLKICEDFCLVLLRNSKIYKLQPKVNAILEEVKLGENLGKHSFKRNIGGELKLENFPNIQIKHIACGELIAVAISRDNVVYTIPNRVHKFEGNFHVQQVECGVEHALLLDRNGNVYSWGAGLRGQLDNGAESVSSEVPILIESLVGIKITFIAAGGWHSAAVTSQGDLYTWGYNSHGQLGLRIYKTEEAIIAKEPTTYLVPQMVNIPLEYECGCSNEEGNTLCDIVAVYAGTRHTVVRLDCGALLVTGSNNCGQLGLCSSIDIIDELTMLDDKSNKIICGSWCTIIDGNINAHGWLN